MVWRSGGDEGGACDLLAMELSAREDDLVDETVSWRERSALPPPPPPALELVVEEREPIS